MKPVFQAILHALIWLMPFVYLGFGLALLIYPSYFSNLQREMAIILGITLIVYSFYRGYRTYQKFNQKHE